MNNTLTILLGFGGSGCKTIAKLADLMTNDPVAARFAKERLHVVCCDTDERDLRDRAKDIKTAFNDRCPGLDLQVELFSLSTSVDVFCDLVQERVRGHGEDATARMKDHWWYQGGVPFSAKGLPLSASAGAGQCPMVSHFLAWDKLSKFPAILEKIDAYARNERHMENYSVDLIMVAGLAGGTGRGCWQTLSFKAREHFGRLGQACRPFGFFFDQSVFSDVQNGRPEQRIKLRVNALTGLSELAMWLRSDRKMPGDPITNGAAPRERRFRLPDFARPQDMLVDTLDTDRYMPETDLARVGRSPIHKAYIFTNSSSSMELHRADDAYRLCAAAIFGRTILAQLRSADANQPSRAAATATSILYVPSSDIRKVILSAAKIERARSLLNGWANGKAILKSVDKERVSFADANSPSARSVLGLTAWLEELIKLPTARDLQISASDELTQSHAISGQLGMESSEVDSQFDDFATAMKQDRAKDELRESLADACREQREPAAERFMTAAKKALGLDDDQINYLDTGKLGGHKATDFAEADSKKRRARLVELVLNRIWKSNGVSASGAIASSIHDLSRDAGDSLGVPHAAILDLSRCIMAAQSALQARLQKVTDPQGQVTGLMSEFERSRRGWVLPPLTWLGVRKVSSGKRRNLLQQSQNLRAEVELKPILENYKWLIDDLAKALKEWKANSDAVIATIGGSVALLEAAHERHVNAYFTRTTDERGNEGRNAAEASLTQLRLDESDPISRQIRMLRPIYREEQFSECVRETLGQRRDGDHLKGELVERLLAADFSDVNSIGYTKERRTTERTQFRQTLEDRLRNILSCQEAPDETLQRYALPSVLQDLVEYWGGLYGQNSGDLRFVRELNELVEKICGVNFDDLKRAQRKRVEEGLESEGEQFRMPDMTEIISRTALRIASKCDPLVRMPDERVQQGDLVNLFLPDTSFGTARKEHGPWEQFINDAWRKDPANFRHVQTDVFKDNPYMLVATSDHPKKDFDQNGWTGWTSFKYWEEPAIREWLLRCEDPEGESVFLEGMDDSIGLGYIHPSYVRDQHWARRRWRPWVDERGQKTQDRRKWDALAYALLGNPMYAAGGGAVADAELPCLKGYNEFLAKWNSMPAVNPSFPTERLTLPLIAELGSDSIGPKFTRRLFEDANEVTRQLGFSPTESENNGSTRRFIEWFKSDASREQLNAVLKEQCIFGKLLISRDDHFHDVLSTSHREQIRTTLQEFVRRWKEHVADPRVTRREDDRTEQFAFLSEFQSVLDDKTFDVLRPFDAAAAHH